MTRRPRDLESDDVDDEIHARARLLQERFRVGDLTVERLELAALLGSGEAHLVLSASSVPNLVDVASLTVHGREVVERGCVATVRLLLPCWRAAFPDDVRVPSAVERAERLIVGLEGREDAARIDGLGTAEHDAARVLPDRYESAQALAAVAVDYAFAGVLHGGMGVEVVADHSRRALARSLGVAEEEARVMIHDAIASDLVPWALGFGDPLRDRQLRCAGRELRADEIHSYDDEVHELERRWKETGLVQDAERLAQARRRAGDPDQLAWDGHEDFTVLLDGEYLSRAELLLDDLVLATESRFGGSAEEARSAAAKRHTATVQFECARHVYRALCAGGLEHREAWARAYAFVCDQLRRQFPLAPVGFYKATRSEGQKWWSVLHEEFRAEKWAYPAGVEDRLPSN